MWKTLRHKLILCKKKERLSGNDVIFFSFARDTDVICSDVSI